MVYVQLGPLKCHSSLEQQNSQISFKGTHEKKVKVSLYVRKEGNFLFLFFLGVTKYSNAHSNVCVPKRAPQCHVVVTPLSTNKK